MVGWMDATLAISHHAHHQKHCVCSGSCCTNNNNKMSYRLMFLSTLHHSLLAYQGPVEWVLHGDARVRVLLGARVRGRCGRVHGAQAGGRGAGAQARVGGEGGQAGGVALGQNLTSGGVRLAIGGPGGGGGGGRQRGRAEVQVVGGGRGRAGGDGGGGGAAPARGVRLAGTSGDRCGSTGEPDAIGGPDAAGSQVVDCLPGRSHRRGALGDPAPAAEGIARPDGGAGCQDHRDCRARRAGSGAPTGGWARLCAWSVWLACLRWPSDGQEYWFPDAAESLHIGCIRPWSAVPELRSLPCHTAALSVIRSATSLSKSDAAGGLTRLRDCPSLIRYSWIFVVEISDSYIYYNI